eukprot:TRINITY_DN5663_c0_g2_i1.p1 TRINITY_DN5663_c0_g2~~TRINITY_DN5663_c0_g2_i1.p1  ORF type:complete len:411 (+),score=161.14 TRINITY_DN5663_c0_g2_i1:104-1234(+)
MAHLAELWVYPVKSCRGTQISSSELVKSGLALDRQWCIVDVEGTRYIKMEYLSQRKMPCLATIDVEMKLDEGRLVLKAEGMEDLKVPIREEAYKNEEDVEVSCSGMSTTDPENASWCLGTIKGKSAGRKAADWCTQYLNGADVEKKNRKPARYMLVRMNVASTRTMRDYTHNNLEGTHLPRAQMHKFRVGENDGTSFQDFAPFLLVSRNSLEAANRAMGTTGYPITPARASLVVDGAVPWEEEDWAEFAIGPIRFHKIKECPRCSIPCRNQETGGFVFQKGQFNGVKGTSLEFTKVLDKMFPWKKNDEEWGKWKAPVFGVYVGHDGASGTLEVGMKVEVTKRVERPSTCGPSAVVLPAVGALAAVAAYFFLKPKAQ